MSLNWTPRWKIVEIDVEGIRLRVPRDEVSGLLSCPICHSIEESNGRYFFDERSLINHMITHAKL
ncbi:hypothetical protein EYM_03070 [Ignicoccus islandicus DSM 13165]|uniref:Uncharacterized protein n=1 Tax=Ignicoccus islandicus DSM 13165 TaxID=940295 RepID=A0A0U3FML4_9CREN|nr:hypothetical protein [Ignicoccus islandicus]ALU11615.1 hypothetical protein EYM_03070 [Ignicoccus islandicus DSM 13165]